MGRVFSTENQTYFRVSRLIAFEKPAALRPSFISIRKKKRIVLVYHVAKND